MQTATGLQKTFAPLPMRYDVPGRAGVLSREDEAVCPCGGDHCDGSLRKSRAPFSFSPSLPLTLSLSSPPSWLSLVAMRSVSLLSRNVFIVAAKRTPCGAFGGALKDHSATDLAALAAADAIKHSGLKPELIDAAIFGNVRASSCPWSPAWSCIVVVCPG